MLPREVLYEKSRRCGVPGALLGALLHLMVLGSRLAVLMIDKLILVL